MGVFDFLTNLVKREPVARPIITQTGMASAYPVMTGDVYSSEIVAQAVRCIVGEMRKLKPKHILETPDSVDQVADDVAAILARPNEIMTVGDFIENITYQLFKSYNVYIYPTFVDVAGVRKYTGLYPLRPTATEFLQDDAGTMFVRFTFANGKRYTLPYADVIHWRYQFSTADFVGGDVNGLPDNRALFDVLGLNKSVRDSMAKAAKAPVNGVVSYGSIISEDKLREQVARFNADLKNNDSGILSLDAKSQFQQVTRSNSIVDVAAMDFLKQEIVDHYGVSVPMLHSVATVEEKQAFYDKTIEPLVDSLNQCFTDVLLTSGKRSRGHKVVFYERDLLFMTMQQKIELINATKELGIFDTAEYRAMFGYAPVGERQRLRSLNYVSTEIADTYQLNNSGAANGDAGEGD